MRFALWRIGFLVIIKSAHDAFLGAYGDFSLFSTLLDVKPACDTFIAQI